MKDKEQIKSMLIDNYFSFLKLDSLEKHFAGFTDDFRTFRGNSESARDNGLEEYRKRLESRPPWLRLHEPVHRVNEEDIKISLDISDQNMASATVWLTDAELAWFEVFSLRKEDGTWKIFKLRSIPEGGAPP